MKSKSICVLMSVYSKDNKSNFQKAFESVTINQTLKPDCVILVVDGRINEELYEYIKILQSKSEIPTKVIINDENLGLAKSLNIGLSVADSEYICRMDSDDISKSDRIEKIMSFFEKYKDAAMVGSWYEIFEQDEFQPYAIRKVPFYVNEEPNFFKKRAPINHPTIIFKRKIANDVGGYSEDVGNFEDWDFVLKFIQKGYNVYNLQESLLYFRAPLDIMERRGGWTYLVKELNYLYKFIKKGYIGYPDYLYLFFSRFLIRLLPNKLRFLVYKVIIWRL